MTLLCLQRVTKRFPAGREEIAVLDHVSLQIEDGDFVGVQGERRSGKSILLRIAAGWERPDEGRVEFADVDLMSLSEGGRAKLRRRGGIGLVSGRWHPNGNKPAIRHVQEALACDRVSLREAAEPAHRALERVGLAQCAFTPSDRLSQGELLRLGLAQRLVHNPRLLLVDEPAVLPRPSETAAFNELLCSLGRSPGLAVVIASEELAPIRAAQRMFSLHGGELRSMERPAAEVVNLHEQRAGARQRSRS
jgi:predicted ABC-type transport system involved in lysophospholipase L1 biosynthesis ATPase subunit